MACYTGMSLPGSSQEEKTTVLRPRGSSG